MENGSTVLFSFVSLLGFHHIFYTVGVSYLPMFVMMRKLASIKLTLSKIIDYVSGELQIQFFVCCHLKGNLP